MPNPAPEECGLHHNHKKNPRKTQHPTTGDKPRWSQFSPEVPASRHQGHQSGQLPEQTRTLFRPDDSFFGGLSERGALLAGKALIYPARILYPQRVGASLKYRIISGLVAGLWLGTSCGDPTPSERSRDRAAAPGARCINCDSESPPVPAPVLKETDILKVFPAHLSFFNDFDGELPRTDSVTVINSTESTVLLSNVQVVNVQNHQAEKSGAAYFTTNWAPGASVVLQPGFVAQIAVTFSPTTELRSALLVITTSHPEFTRLEVSLTGKHFITDGGF